MKRLSLLLNAPPSCKVRPCFVMRNVLSDTRFHAFRIRLLSKRLTLVYKWLEFRVICRCTDSDLLNIPFFLLNNP